MCLLASSTGIPLSGYEDFWLNSEQEKQKAKSKNVEQKRENI